MAITAGDFNWYVKKKNLGGKLPSMGPLSIYVAAPFSDETAIGKIVTDLFESSIEVNRFEKEGLGGFIHSKDLGKDFTFFRPQDFLVAYSTKNFAVVSFEEFTSNYTIVVVK